MKVDRWIEGDLRGAAASAAESERLGLDGVLSPETTGDPFLPLVLAVPATQRVQLGTCIALAFTRSPMTTAVVADQLAGASQGRFVLGLGTQVRAHIERRFSMVWSQPARRMREYVLALRAIWGSWQSGEALDFRGEFFQHTLMPPAFIPPRHPYGCPPVFLAAVGPAMMEVAGEVADGIHLHSFASERYIREQALPAIERGLARAGRTRDSIAIKAPTFVVCGATPEEYEREAAETRRQIAFYASTPAYRRVLEVHGWGDLQSELHELTREGRWDDMAALIDDEVLETFAVCGEPNTIADRIVRRWGELCDRVRFNAIDPTTDPDGFANALAVLRAGGRS